MNKPKRTLLFVTSILMIPVGIILAVFCFSQLYHYDIGPVTPNADLGNLIASILYILLFVLGIVGIACHRKPKCTVCRVFAVIIFLAALVDAYFLEIGATVVNLSLLFVLLILYFIGAGKKTVKD